MGHPPRQVDLAPGGQDVLFLTMELLVGETLAERLRRVGRLSPREAQPIVEQMAAGLAAAHRAGVVHRDFKTDNVILVPDAHGQLRAVVSDFGVARALGGGAASLTADEMVGSPAYIAPEQLEGKPITPATDVYALGVVLFEMVTGKLPFEGDNAIGTAMMRLTAPAPAARSVLPGLDARWDQAIRRALERESGKRFQTVEELVYALLGEEGLTSAIAAGRLGTSGPYRVLQRKRRWVAWIVGAVLALAGGAVGYWRLHGVTPPDGSSGGEPAVRVRRTVAVLGFKNLSGRAENAWLSTALAEMLTVEISASEQIRTVPGENVARARAELGLTDAAQLSEQSLSGLRRVLGADLVVGGSYLALGEGAGGQLRFDVRLQRAADAEVIAQVSETGSEAGLVTMASAAGAKLREKLGLAAVTPGALEKAQAKLPADPKAARYYAEGLDALHRFDAEQARIALEKAVEADPSWPLAHSQLAEAYLLLGYSGKAKIKAKDALDRADKLTREDALYVQALYDRAMEDWPKTAEDFRSLVAFFPDNPEYLLELGNSLQKAGKPAEAIAELDRLRKLPPPASQDPRIDLAEASSAEVQSDFKRMQRASAAAADKAMASGARLLLARARISEGWAVAHLGSERPTAADDALKLFDEARRLCAEVNDRACLAEALNVIGTALSGKKDEVGALKAYKESLEIRRTIGDRSGMLDVSNNMGLSQEAAGDAAGAMETFKVALTIAREMGYAPALAKILGNIGQQELRHDEYVAGMAHTEEGSKLLRQVGDNRSYYITVNILQTYSYGAGELATSRRWAEEYISFAKGRKDWWKAAMMVKREGDMARDDGDLPLARRRYQESAAFSALETEKKREGWWTYEVECALADLDLEEGAKPEAVEAKARQLLERFEKKGEKTYVNWSKVLLVETLRRQNKLAETHQLLDPIVAKFHPLEPSSERPLFAAELIYPRLLLADGKRSEAVAAAQKTVEMVAGKKWLTWALESRLVAGEVELGAGRKVEGRTRLLQVKKDAEAKHLARYAARAAALLGK
jgi:tetratricopeptide (TPR) repeat protein